MSTESSLSVQALPRKELQVGLGSVERVYIAALDTGKGVQHDIDEGRPLGCKSCSSCPTQASCCGDMVADAVEGLHELVVPMGE